MKSIESKKFLPGVRLKSDSKLKLKAVPMPKVQAKKEIAKAEYFRDKNPSSDRYATPGSSNEIDELNAATESYIKNKEPMIWPNCI